MSDRSPRTVPPNVNFESISFVPAPTCDACGREMVGADSYRWACPNLECSKAGEPLHLGGCYPLRPIEEVVKSLTSFPADASMGYKWLPEEDHPKAQMMPAPFWPDHVVVSFMIPPEDSEQHKSINAWADTIQVPPEVPGK